MRNRTSPGGKVWAAGMLLICLLRLLISPALAAGPGGAALTVEQVFTSAGSSAPPSKTFSYRLQPAQEAIGQMAAGSAPGGCSFTIDATDSIELPLTFTQAGEYIYVLTHTTAAAPGYAYDQKTYTLKFIVGSDLHVTVVACNEDGGKALRIQYEHIYSDRPSDPLRMTDTPVVKTVAGNPLWPSTFTFELRAGSPANPMPAGSANGVKAVQITGSGSAAFGTWTYTAQGTYYYTVAEVNTGARGYTYDTTLYTITDTVTGADGQLVLARIVTNHTKQRVTSCSFINTYKRSWLPPSIPITTPQVPIPATPKTPATPAAPIGPKTGDEARGTLYIVLLCIAGGAALGSAAYLLAGKRRGGARKKRTAARAILALSLCAVAAAGYQLRNIQRAYRQGDRAYEQLAGLARPAAPGDAAEIPEIDFAALQAVNPDTAAWLYCPGTPIDYPVMRARDYDYYLRRLPDGAYNANGTLFIDYNNAPDFSGGLTVIYGHHMKTGKMFGSLKGYKQQAYFEAHPYLYLYTPGGKYRIELLYGCVIGAGEWRERAFMYEANLDALLAYAARSTTFASTAEYHPGDRVAALSTCSYEFDGARYVVLGVLRP